MAKPLHVINGEELMDMDYKPIKFAVREFLTQGLAILAGAPKTGKSFFVLQRANVFGTMKHSKDQFYISVWRTMQSACKTEFLP